ncbi:divergent polysaccharide deacetylase family protein [Agaribacterium sp. ZY112]|uniref:divergent polysaccharide deacetylase family protein n=1 Tax=Agaribacterium sp. ZY112 TaxID=3233574 RepID=UPI003523FD51
MSSCSPKEPKPSQSTSPYEFDYEHSHQAEYKPQTELKQEQYAPPTTAVSLPLIPSDSQAPSHSEELNVDITPTPFKQESDSGKPRIAIVIDDLGYNYRNAETIAELPYALTLAVIPETPYAKQVAALAEKQQQELILHIPMEPLNRPKWEDGLSTHMQRAEFDSELKNLLDSEPRIVGVNNHGGSKLTADRTRMEWLMEELATRDLYFLDSRTNAQSQGIYAAQAHYIAHNQRDVFLDNQQEEQAISEQFQLLRSIAKRHGQAVAIGHPHDATLAVLQQELPALEAEGFELVFCSELLTRYTTKNTDPQQAKNTLSP